MVTMLDNDSMTREDLFTYSPGLEGCWGGCGELKCCGAGCLVTGGGEAFLMSTGEVGGGDDTRIESETGVCICC